MQGVYTEVGVLVVLIVGAPEEWPDAACALDCPIWEIHGNDHRLVHLGPQTDNVGSEGFGVLCVLLETYTN